jgi:predicted TIM-barrel fold metal-dependent hydrolase
VGIVGHPPVREESIPFIEAAAAREGLCNLHLHDVLMGKIARMFPQTTFIVHASNHAVENFASLDNVWFEVVQYPNGYGTEWDFNQLANKAGKDRIMFGADLPYYDYRFLQKFIEAADIDDDLKDRIAYKNVIRLIHQYNPNWQMPEAPMKAPRIYEPEELWACNPQRLDRLTVYA